MLDMRTLYPDCEVRCCQNVNVNDVNHLSTCQVWISNYQVPILGTNDTVRCTRSIRFGSTEDDINWVWSCTQSGLPLFWTKKSTLQFAICLFWFLVYQDWGLEALSKVRGRCPPQEPVEIMQGCSCWCDLNPRLLRWALLHRCWGDIIKINVKCRKTHKWTAAAVCDFFHVFFSSQEVRLIRRKTQILQMTKKLKDCWRK